MKKTIKLTPMMENGVSLNFTLEDNPIEKPTHLHFRWAKEKCPVCNSAVMMIYCPTQAHEVGFGAALPEQDHKMVFTCVKCNLLLTQQATKG